MVEVFISSIIENLLWKLVVFGYNEIPSVWVWSVKTDLQKLKSTLLTIQVVLLDAEEQKPHNQGLRLWLDKLKDVCYDAEDALDQFEVEALRKQFIMTHGTFKTKVRHLFSSSNPLVVSFKLSSRIKNIRETLDAIACEKTQFHFTENIARSHMPVMLNWRETHSFVEPAEVIGRDEDKQILATNLLTSVDTSNPSVIPIVGIGGIGKTTLAKFVYNDREVSKHFSLKLWVCVSNDFELKPLIVKIIKSISNQDCNSYDLDQLQHHLRALLRNQRYLLILDDVWNEDSTKWDDLKYLLTGGVSGSKIIVTTRSHRVATIMGTISPVNLKCLPFESCLSLFIKCAFRDGKEREHPNLFKTAEEIVKKCYGIPLVVKTIGSLLSSVTDERRWIFIRDNKVWEHNLEMDGSLLAVLKLSYDNLPSPLKSCFVYCSLFPKGHEFKNIELIQYWMANGLLKSHQQSEELEDVGFMYLMELWSRSFFQDFKDYGPIVIFKMHDIMHDLAISVANNECVCVDERRQQRSKNARHLAISNIGILEQEKNILAMLGNMNNIRTFICPKLGSETFLNKCLSKCKSLRVLNLKSSSFKVLPHSIGDLKQLRVLDLGGNKRIKKLPISICVLHNLQWLNIGGCTELEELPKDMKFMISLRSLILTTKQKSLSQTGIACLKSLRTLRLTDCENLEYLFAGMECPPTLQTLVIFNCPRLISLPCGLKLLASLKSLVIDNCQELNFAEDFESVDDVNSLFSLRSLIIIGELPKLINLPSWLLQGSLNSLEVIFISNCENLTELPESLPSLALLKFLRIEGCPSLITLPRGMNRLTALKKLLIMDCESLNLTMTEGNDQDQLGGLKLEILGIVGLPQLKALPQWLLQGSILSLESMCIAKCRQLKTLPVVIPSLTSLKSLYIINCPQLTERCKTGIGEDVYKIALVQKWIIINCDQADLLEENSFFIEAFFGMYGATLDRSCGRDLPSSRWGRRFDLL